MCVHRHTPTLAGPRSPQRLAEIEEPLFVLNAYDDPIAPGPYVPLDAGHANPNVLVALTAHGGHLGWCDRGDPWGGPRWTERVCCGFLEAALEIEPSESCETVGCEVFD